ncbi:MULTISPECIES: hypothetical protein [unclassified Anaerobiospirillum]|uniref:hypothetical protein n=1 Tax=unclassified Anaerobiospirillum TaxID=2647410 RepID=UPI001FF258C3|nr:MULTISPECIES: hypothetical protein [unclassified Anaerobiospirillum]MCK0534565.1 hypothetical protein [Anaerobiospirillum sp. NML120511]MCK0540603.1 hypothetical protein [Anaerobiospirillum sp. NML02-A-032]
MSNLPSKRSEESAVSKEKSDGSSVHDSARSSVLMMGEYQVKDLHQLREHFNLQSILRAWYSGELIEFCLVHRLAVEYRALLRLKDAGVLTSLELSSRLCRIFGVHRYPMEIQSELSHDQLCEDVRIIAARDSSAHMYFKEHEMHESARYATSVRTDFVKSAWHSAQVSPVIAAALCDEQYSEMGSRIASTAPSWMPSLEPVFPPQYAVPSRKDRLPHHRNKNSYTVQRRRMQPVTDILGNRDSNPVDPRFLPAQELAAENQHRHTDSLIKPVTPCAATEPGQAISSTPTAHASSCSSYGDLPAGTEHPGLSNPAASAHDASCPATLNKDGNGSSLSFASESAASESESGADPSAGASMTESLAPWDLNKGKVSTDKLPDPADSAPQEQKTADEDEQPAFRLRAGTAYRSIRQRLIDSRRVYNDSILVRRAQADFSPRYASMFAEPKLPPVHMPEIESSMDLSDGQPEEPAPSSSAGTATAAANATAGVNTSAAKNAAAAAAPSADAAHTGCDNSDTYSGSPAGDHGARNPEAVAATAAAHAKSSANAHTESSSGTATSCTASAPVCSAPVSIAAGEESASVAAACADTAAATANGTHADNASADHHADNATSALAAAAPSVSATQDGKTDNQPEKRKRGRKRIHPLAPAKSYKPDAAVMESWKRLKASAEYKEKQQDIEKRRALEPERFGPERNAPSLSASLSLRSKSPLQKEWERHEAAPRLDKDELYSEIDRLTCADLEPYYDASCSAHDNNSPDASHDSNCSGQGNADNSIDLESLIATIVNLSGPAQPQVPADSDALKTNNSQSADPLPAAAGSTNQSTASPMASEDNAYADAVTAETYAADAVTAETYAADADAAVTAETDADDDVTADTDTSYETDKNTGLLAVDTEPAHEPPSQSSQQHGTDDWPAEQKPAEHMSCAADGANGTAPVHERSTGGDTGVRKDGGTGPVHERTVGADISARKDGGAGPVHERSAEADISARKDGGAGTVHERSAEADISARKDGGAGTVHERSCRPGTLAMWDHPYGRIQTVVAQGAAGHDWAYANEHSMEHAAASEKLERGSPCTFVTVDQRSFSYRIHGFETGVMGLPIPPFNEQTVREIPADSAAASCRSAVSKKKSYEPRFNPDGTPVVKRGRGRPRKHPPRTADSPGAAKAHGQAMSASHGSADSEAARRAAREHFALKDSTPDPHEQQLASLYKSTFTSLHAAGQQELELRDRLYRMKTMRSHVLRPFEPDLNE